VRILVTVSLRFPPQGKSAEGEADPKVRPKGVIDGQPVNIPALLERCPRGTHGSRGVEPSVGPPGHQDCPVERRGAPLVFGKSLELHKPLMTVPRKARREITSSESVLKLTQVGEASSLRCARELWLRNSAN
jgi:hypothetical protein